MNYISRSFLLLLSASLILLVSLTGCATPGQELTPIPTVTPAATLEPSPTIDWFPRTPTPTQTPYIPPTIAPTQPDQVPYVGSLLFADDFSDTSLWTTSQTTDGNVVYGKQVLSLAVAGDKGTLTSISQYSIPQDFYMEMTAGVALCQNDDQYGVNFWTTAAGDRHRLMLTCDGQIRLERLFSGGGALLQDWTYASRFIPGAPAEQRIGLWARQGEIRVYVNGVFQFSVRTTQDGSGGLGVYARANGETAMTVGFSQLAVYQVEGGE